MTGGRSKVIEPAGAFGYNEGGRTMKDLEKTVAVRDRRFLLRVETSHGSEDYGMYEDLRNAIWDFPDDRLSGPRNMMCENVFHEGGSLFMFRVPARWSSGKSQISSRNSSYIL